MNKINLQKQKKNVLFTLDDNFNMGEGFTTMHENGNTIFTQKYPTFPTKYSQIHLETVDSVVNKKGIEYDALTNQFSRNEQATFIRGRMKAVEQLIYAEFTNVLNNVTASVIVDLIDRVYCKYGKTLQLDMSNILSSIHVPYMTYNGIPRANVKNESYYDYMAGSLVMITIPNVMTRISEGLYKELYINIRYLRRSQYRPGWAWWPTRRSRCSTSCRRSEQSYSSPRPKRGAAYLCRRCGCCRAHGVGVNPRSKDTTRACRPCRLHPSPPTRRA